MAAQNETWARPRAVDVCTMAGRVRALIVKTGLEKLADQPGTVRRRIEARLDPQMVARTRTSLRMDWLPVDDHYALGLALAAELDEPEQLRHWFDVFDLEFDRSLLAPIVSSAHNLFGRSPGGLCRVLPRTWTYLFSQEAPQVEFVAAEGELDAAMCEVALRNVPRRDVADMSNLVMRAVIALFYARCETVGEVLDSVIRRGDSYDLEYQLEWDPALRDVG